MSSAEYAPVVDAHSPLETIRGYDGRNFGQKFSRSADCEEKCFLSTHGSSIVHEQSEDTSNVNICEQIFSI